MLSQTDAVKQAWAATDRTLDIIVTVDGKDYQATEINSVSYDAGAFTGDTLGIGSTYENSVTIEFSSVVEAFKQGLTVLPKVGILVDGKFEYTSLGTFIVSEVNRDRNNNLTTIKALDQMCKLEGQYKPTVSDMASPLDIIADIANQGVVTVNTGELQHLPALPNIKRIEGQTLRTAIGWVAQLYGGFATFDRDGKLTIRTTATPNYTITPGEYQQGGLTKNEVSYKTGGIKVTVNTKKTDDSGQEVDDTTTLQAGETTGSQIELTNDSMTNDLLTTVWTGIKDITYYPYTLNWFGNPNLEAGDWVTLTDTQGNQFNVPVNQYTMSFNGGLESTISATQSSSTAGGYAYTGSAGSIKNMIEALQVRHTASGNNVYPPSYQGQPQNPKKGDVWYKQNGNNVEVWIYQEDDGKLSWVRTPLDGEVKAELQALGTKTNEDLTRVKSELSSEAESQWQSMKTATSEVANDLSATKASLAAVSNDLSATKTSLADTRNNLATTTSDLTSVKADLVDTKNTLTTTTNDLKSNLSAVSNDLSAAKTDLENTKASLSTTVENLQKQTGQLSGSLETANSKIEYNSNAIAEVKHTAEEISTTVVGGGNNLLNNTSDTLKTFTGQEWMRESSASDIIPTHSIDGNEVTLSAWIENPSKEAWVQMYTDKGRFLGNKIPAGGSGWSQVTYTMPSGWWGWNVVVGCGDGSGTITLSYKDVKLELGPNRTAWKPSNGDIAQLKVTADAIKADLTNTKGDVASVKATANSLQSQITDNKNNISSVKQTADSLTTRMSNAEGNVSSLQQTTSGLTTRVSNTEGNVSGLQQTATKLQSDLTNAKGDISSLQQTANGLTSRVGNAEGNISQLQQTASGLTADMKDAKGNISSLQQTAQGLTTRVSNAEGNISSVQETAKKLQATVGDDNTGLVSYVKAIPGQISSAITASKQATVITSAVDLHNMTTAGFYLLKGTLTNSPVDAWTYLRVITSDSGDRIYHQLWKDVDSTVYTEYWAGAWSDWATHINSENLKSNVITAINQSTEGVSITGSKITLDGNVNIAPGFTLSADYIKAGTLSADRISGGTLDLSSNITVKGLTANSISSGSISGQNLNINLDNGVVEFTKGNLHSTDGGFNISIDTKSFYLGMGNDSKLWIDSNGFHLQESATQHLWMDKNGLHNYTDANTNGLWINDTTLKVLNSNGEGLVAQNGLLQFSTLPTWLNFGANSTLTAQAYGLIGPDKNLFGSQNGLFVKGREGVVIGTNSYNGETFLGSLFNADSISGSGISLSDDMTKAAMFFTKAPLILAGGPTWPDSNNMSVKPYISVGSEWYYSHNGAGMDQVGRGTYTRGNDIIVSARNTNIIGYDWISFKSFGRIALDADYVHSYPTYLKTTSSGANVFVAPDGALIRSSSARKYKTDIQDANNAYGEKLIEFAPKKWIDKAEKKRYEEDPENNKKPGYYYGLIADDLDAAGLDMLVNYGAEGEVEGINYDRLAVALLPVIKSLKGQVASLKKQLKALTK